MSFAADWLTAPHLAPFVVDEAQLVVEPITIATGHRGMIFRGSYQQQPVCVKVRAAGCACVSESALLVTCFLVFEGFSPQWLRGRMRWFATSVWIAALQFYFVWALRSPAHCRCCAKLHGRTPRASPKIIFLLLPSLVPASGNSICACALPMLPFVNVLTRN